MLNGKRQTLNVERLAWRLTSQKEQHLKRPQSSPQWAYLAAKNYKQQEEAELPGENRNQKEMTLESCCYNWLAFIDSWFKGNKLMLLY